MSIHMPPIKCPCCERFVKVINGKTVYHYNPKYGNEYLCEGSDALLPPGAPLVFQHLPEEWTDKNGKRRLTCSCGNMDPAHTLKPFTVEA